MLALLPLGSRVAVRVVEPLLAGLDFFRRAVRFQRHYAGGKRIVNTLQTNGTLITAEWAAFFRHNNFLVGLSLDGPEVIHDRFRMDRDEAIRHLYGNVVERTARIRPYRIVVAPLEIEPLQT